MIVSSKSIPILTNLLLTYYYEEIKVIFVYPNLFLDEILLQSNNTWEQLSILWFRKLAKKQQQMQCPR